MDYVFSDRYEIRKNVVYLPLKEVIILSNKVYYRGNVFEIKNCDRIFIDVKFLRKEVYGDD